jgi:hypothetical protein
VEPGSHRFEALTRSALNVTIGTLMRGATHTEREAAQAPVEVEADEPSLAWPQADPRWLLIPEPEDDSEVERRNPAQAIEAFNRMLEDRQREPATEVGTRR